MVTQTFEPSTVGEAQEIILSGRQLVVTGLDRHRDWGCVEPVGEVISAKKLNRILRVEPADQVCEVEAGIEVTVLQKELAAKGQCLPWLPFEQSEPSVGGAISLNLPHRHEGHWGSWRDWTLGVSIILPGGALARAGNSAVKNVAGYDFQRFIAGTRGSLGLMTSVILRTLPLSALSGPECGPIETEGNSLIFQRLLRSQADAMHHYPHSVYNPDSQTLCVAGLEWDALKRFPEDWVIGKGYGPRNLEPLDPDQAAFWRHLKLKIDPNRQFGDHQFPMKSGL